MMIFFPESDPFMDLSELTRIGEKWQDNTISPTVSLLARTVSADTWPFPQDVLTIFKNIYLFVFEGEKERE